MSGYLASSSRDVSSATASSLTQEAGFVDARAIMGTVDVGESRESRRSLASESDDSVDLLFEAWPGSLQELLDDELLSL